MDTQNNTDPRPKLTVTVGRGLIAGGSFCVMLGVFCLFVALLTPLSAQALPWTYWGGGLGLLAIVGGALLLWLSQRGEK